MSPTDRKTLRRGTEAHYENAAYYDQTYRRRREDQRFYADLAEDGGGPVLELGCGTGRVTLAMAKRGVSVVGVDRMREMLARAAERRARLPKSQQSRIELKRGDLTRLRLKRRFPLVVSPFNVFMHLYERRDVERALTTVRRHLTPRGRFVFDVLLPDPAALARNPDRLYRGGQVRHPSDGHRYVYRENFRYDPVTQVQLVTMSFQDEGDPSRIVVTPLAHRQFFPAELEALLHYNGFVLEARYGDFAGGPLDRMSESQVCVARLRRR